jgi:predicted nucleotidyltransferase
MRSEAAPTEPWRSFLADLDGRLKGPIELRCLGGFVVTQQYGIGRETSDIDFLVVIAQSPEDNVEALAGLGSELHRKYRLYMQHVGVATPPADYARRLIRMFPAAPWRQLKLFALDATDIALSKLERNAERDREDFLRLAHAGYIHRQVLRDRYYEELRPYLLSKTSWHDKTLELWLEMAWPTAQT